MIVLLSILVYASVPLLVSGRNNCPLLDAQLEKERIQDEEFHQCRNCKAFEPEDVACPEVGYECDIDWEMTTNVLSPAGCTCAEIRCADTTARLALDGDIVHKLRCNSSVWVNGEGESGKAICAKRCDIGVCAKSNTKANQYKYRPLNVVAATAETKCATATCDHGFAVINEDGSFSKDLSVPESLLCSGDSLWSTASEQHKYVMCKPLPCQTCDTSVLIDPSHPACATQNDIFCTTNPYKGEDNGGCPSLGCGEGSELYLLNATANVAVSKIKCEGGDWMHTFAGSSSTPASPIGYVCAKPATCDSCTQAVSIRNADIVQLGLPNANKPTCEYSCPANHNLIVKGLIHKSIVCQMDTQDVTVDSSSGEPVTEANKFTCKLCNCPSLRLTEGQNSGLCDIGKLCTRPARGINKCEASCPERSTAIYTDVSGQVRTSPTIKCTPSNDWIAQGNKEVTCRFDNGEGFTKTPPTVATPCAALKTLKDLKCADAACDAKQLIYVPDGAGYKIMCKEGSLTTDHHLVRMTGYCGIDGQWSSSIVAANCITDKSQVADCLSKMTDVSTSNNVKFTCAYGSCFLYCKRKGQKFEYSAPTPGLTTATHLKCEGDAIFARHPHEAIAQPDQIKCVYP